MSSILKVTFTREQVQLVAHAAGAQAAGHCEIPPILPEHAEPTNIPAEIQNVLQLAQELLLASTGAAGVAMALGGLEGMQCVSSLGDAPPVGIPLQLGNTLSGECVRTGRVVGLNCEPGHEHRGPRSVLLAPVFLQGSVAGLVGIFSGEWDAFDSGSMAAIRHAASLIGCAITNLQLRRSLPLPQQVGWDKISKDPPRALAAPPEQIADPSDAGPTKAATRPRRLLGLPCPHCGTYLFADECVCDICGTPRASPA